MGVRQRRINESLSQMSGDDVLYRCKGRVVDLKQWLNSLTGFPGFLLFELSPLFLTGTSI